LFFISPDDDLLAQPAIRYKSKERIMKKHNYFYLMLTLIFFISIHGCGPSVSDQLPAFESEMKAFKESIEYRSFLEYWEKAVAISNQGLYDQYKDSSELDLFFQDFTAFGQKCQSKLAPIQEAVKNRKLALFINDQASLFDLPGNFWGDLERYQKSNAELPDLNQFLTDMKSKQNEIDNKYRKLKFET
jgi:hypothetical protein